MAWTEDMIYVQQASQIIFIYLSLPPFPLPCSLIPKFSQPPSYKGHNSRVEKEKSDKKNEEYGKLSAW